MRILEWVAISFSRGIFSTQGSNPGLLHCRQMLYHLSHQGSPRLSLFRDLGLIPGLGRFPWRRKWQPTPVFLPGESHGWRSLVGYSPQGRKESDTTERLHVHFHFLTAKLGEKMQPIRHQLIFNLPLWQSMCKARQDN